ncbi:MAG: OmpA family protein [Flavobacteriales bacterium]|nr:OmpA family protein [Flavobacteriales bacterium]
MKTPALIALLVSVLFLRAQEEFMIEHVSGLNTGADEIACTVMDDQLIYATNDLQDLVSDYQWVNNKRFSLRWAERGKSFSEFSPASVLFANQSEGDEGTAFYSSTDSTLYFSSANHYSGNTKGKLRIYTSKWNGTSWSKPIMLPFCRGHAHYAHPWYDKKLNVLVFSSNRAGGQGGMDIWYVYKTPTGWNEPASLDVLVNSPGNEVFPTIWHGDIYYASDRLPGFGGYDIHCALQKNQWKVSVQLPAPVNTPLDDINFFMANEEIGFLSSNRAGGAGGDDIYKVIAQFESEKRNYTAAVLVNGEVIKNSQVSVYNQTGEVILEATTGESGSFSLRHLDLNRKYRMKATGVGTQMFASTWLHVYNEEGVRVMQIPMRPDGSFEFELLPYDKGGQMTRLVNVDHSILSLSFEGQVINENKPVQEPSMITIVDDAGEVVAVAYTDQLGKFSVDNVAPDLAYTFRLSEQSKASQVVLFDQGKRLTLPVLREEAHYARLTAANAITLVNEKAETVHLSPEDVFVVNRIYYQYNSSHLSDNSREQLDKLIRILELNPSMQIEIRSHTDSQGSADYNLELSKRRAQVVKDYLVLRGIGATRISATGMGETELLNACPAPDDCTEEERAINRRTEIRIVQSGS